MGLGPTPYRPSRSRRVFVCIRIQFWQISLGCSCACFFLASGTRVFGRVGGEQFVVAIGSGLFREVSATPPPRAGVSLFFGRRAGSFSNRRLYDAGPVKTGYNGDPFEYSVTPSQSVRHHHVWVCATFVCVCGIPELLHCVGRVRKIYLLSAWVVLSCVYPMAGKPFEETIPTTILTKLVTNRCQFNHYGCVPPKTGWVNPKDPSVQRKKLAWK